MQSNGLGRRATQLAAGIALATACNEPTHPDAPLPVASVELSTTSLSLGPAASAALVVTLRGANGAELSGRTVAWSVANPAIAKVSGDGNVTAVSFGTTTVRAQAEGKFAEAGVVVVPKEPAHLAAAWRMDSFNGKAVPAAYATLLNEIVDGRLIAKVEIRLDSATKNLAPTGLYQRRYCFTELHDETVVLKYCWGDHGRFTLGSSVPVRMTLTSEYIQNLYTAGQVELDGSLALNEALWLGEELHATVWSRRL